jgi:hypothetical protein
MPEYLQRFGNQLRYLNAMHYQTNNCDGSRIPQEQFPTYLTHASAKNFVQPYIEPIRIAQAAGKPFVMLETNTASCGVRTA